MALVWSCRAMAARGEGGRPTRRGLRHCAMMRDGPAGGNATPAGCRSPFDSVRETPPGTPDGLPAAPRGEEPPVPALCREARHTVETQGGASPGVPEVPEGRRAARPSRPGVCRPVTPAGRTRLLEPPLVANPAR